MFWALVVSPFVLLAFAATIARKGIIVRFALVLGLMFLVVDGIAFWTLLAEQSSTGSIGMAVIALLQLCAAVILLIASIFSRKATARTKE